MDDYSAANADWKLACDKAALARSAYRSGMISEDDYALLLGRAELAKQHMDACRK